MTERNVSVTFLPTGELDTTNTVSVDLATEPLAPTIAYIRVMSGDIKFDLWKLLNWMCVSYYWIVLYDFGKLAPTSYRYKHIPGLYVTPFGYPDYSEPIFYSATNNIFVNQTLFDIYSSYIRDTIIPAFRQNSFNLSAPDYLPLSDDNHLEPIPMVIARRYACTTRRMKGWASVLLQVLVADYAFIVGGYSIAIFLGEWLQKFRHEEQDGGELSEPV